MANKVPQVYALLADGRFHSGAELARQFGVTRSAVWKLVEQLRALGLTIHAVSGRGYRLQAVAAPLDAGKISAALARAGRAGLATSTGPSVDVAWSLASTNDTLLARPPPAIGSIAVLLAEHQAAGRGRRGRRWLASLGGSICMSIAASFDELPPDAGALSLAMGVCVLRALRPLCRAPLRLKWPNDVLAPGGKLGGILIELHAQSSGPAHVVVGIGVNVKLDAAAQAQVHESGTTAADLASLGVDPLARNEVAARLIDACAAGLRSFASSGFASFRAEWAAADALLDQAVTVTGAGAPLNGIARGIDARGALQLQSATGTSSVVAGDVSLRAQHR